MKEIFTKKNILITSTVLIGIIAIFPVSRYVSTEWNKYNYNQLVEKNIELASSKEKLSQNLLKSMQKKEKTNLRAMYCQGVAHRLHEISQENFNKLWQEVENEDYSEAQLNYEPSVFESALEKEDLVITNIKIEGNTKSRDFIISDKEDYYCVAPFDRQQSLEEQKK